MSNQRHVIKQQILELRISSSDSAWQLQTQISQLYRNQIIPLIEAYCDQISDPDRIHRIDKIEIDIGEINADNLDEEFFQKVAAELYRQLTVGIGNIAIDNLATTPSSPAMQLTMRPSTSTAAEDSLTADPVGDRPDPSPPPTTVVPPPAAPPDQVSHRDWPGLPPPIKPAVAQLELFSHFVQTGHLPWWAEPLSQPALEATLATLMQTAVPALPAILLKACQNQRYLQRLIYQFSDASLGKMVELLAPTADQAISAYGHDLQAVGQVAELLRGLPPDRRRLELWRGIFLSLPAVPASALAQSRGAAQPWLSAVLWHLATSCQINYQQLLANLSTAIATLNQTGYHFKSQLPARLAALSALVVAPGWPADRTLNPKARNAEAKQRLSTLWAVWQDLDAAPMTRPLTAGFRAQIQALMAQASQLMARLDQAAPPFSQTDCDRDMATLIEQWQRLQQEIAIASSITKLIVLENLEESELGINLLISDATLSATDAEIVETFGDRRDRASAPAKIYLHNAGLILLWPFLSRWLAELGYVQAGEFLSAAVAERAVLLLQYLVDCSTTTPEPTLPLNKLLCGLDLDLPIPASIELLEFEQTSAETLLLAVIQHWSVLKNTSIGGLQQAFLQRPGILSICHSNWVLQVERKTYDILLDRLPWSIRVIKLPWMPDALYVEW